MENLPGADNLRPGPPLTFYLPRFCFLQERQMLNKERAVGMYRLTAYFFARTVGDMPLELIMPFVFTIIVYW